MSDPIPQWQIHADSDVPEAFVQAVKQQAPGIEGRYLPQLLWQRGIRDVEQLAGYLFAANYQPTSSIEFGQEMQWAVQRLVQAIERKETIAIWGDFDADGVTSTAVLWDGLGQFFQQNEKLFYYIPNRFTESHGLSKTGIDQLKHVQLIVTCDTGSTNLDEIQYAQSLGIDVIVTDHHTLPEMRPPVIAIVNPRSLDKTHPFASLSGVAVAYKLVEALYEALPDVPETSIENLLDLVAIGLIADLVELKGDCRYLAQKGIEQLQKQSTKEATRPGITRLLELCKRSGDRPTDISFGLGPRINAVSRIQGDAHFCVELLTSQDVQRCRELADETELANTRRKALQKDVLQQAKSKLAQVDLSTTGVIVLWDEQWSAGVLGLVAGQIAQEYGKPTILLTIDDQYARGSARSTNQIDLYQLVKDQEHLLHRFGGHPFAAGLSLAIDNLPLFAQAINQRLLQQSEPATPMIRADLCVTVSDLNLELYKELRLIEPCGMGNPIPKLLIQNCWFRVGRNKKIEDLRGRKVEYIRTPFTIWDESVEKGFPGVWWGHYAYDIPAGRCDAIVELENNTYHKRYEVRLVAVRSCEQVNVAANSQWLLDWRTHRTEETAIELKTAPASWIEFQTWFKRAINQQRPLAIAYSPPSLIPATEVWQTLVGIAKYLSRTGKTATRQQFYDRLQIGDVALKAGIQALEQLCFQVTYANHSFSIAVHQPEQEISNRANAERGASIEQFLTAVREEQFYRQYFAQVPFSTMQAIAAQWSMTDQRSNSPGLLYPNQVPVSTLLE
ncbi:MAG: single-stranded-DNA-specific exonuclease RecJ [Phormidium tanganyikae FI6-MK23]|jgi:single-stranded-DNA-specific exonuclease|nr:single-stranded-DNA-specific exonuclease RecJ [Phormidium tanganyikae FI6-MK23]